jgi:hypothetical protein
MDRTTLVSSSRRSISHRVLAPSARAPFAHSRADDGGARMR